MRQEVEHRARQRAHRHQIVRLQPLGREPADRQERTVHRERGNDGVHARSVRQARVDHRRAVVDAPAHCAHDAVDDAQQMTVVLEVRRHLLEDAGTLDEHVLVAVDQDVADGRIAHQRLQRTESEHVVQDFDEQRLALAQTERRALFAEQLVEQRPDFALRARTVGLRERLEVQPVEQLAMDAGAQIEVLLPRRLWSQRRWRR